MLLWNPTPNPDSNPNPNADPNPNPNADPNPNLECEQEVLLFEIG